LYQLRIKTIEIMATTNTTKEKQAKLIEFAKSLGISLEKLQAMYKDPVKASVLNVIAEGL
jgi:hypothetical protein